MAYPDNEPEAEDGPPAPEELLDLIEKIEGVEEEMRRMRGDRSEFYAVAKSRGYDTRTMKKLVALRKRDPKDLAEEEALLEAYKKSLGMT